MQTYIGRKIPYFSEGHVFKDGVEVLINEMAISIFIAEDLNNLPATIAWREALEKRNIMCWVMRLKEEGYVLGVHIKGFGIDTDFFRYIPFIPSIEGIRAGVSFLCPPFLALFMCNTDSMVVTGECIIQIPERILAYLDLGAKRLAEKYTNRRDLYDNMMKYGQDHGFGSGILEESFVA